MLLPAGVPLSFTAVFDSPSLFVALSVYDDSGASPVLAQAPAAMAVVVGNVYRGKYTAAPGKSYIVVMAVYTSGAFTTLDPAYAQQAVGVNAQYLTPPTQNVIGVVDCGGNS